MVDFLFPFPFNVGLEIIGQFHRKIITKHYWKGERQNAKQLVKVGITISKYHSWYLCQISLQIMLLPIQIYTICKRKDLVLPKLHNNTIIQKHRYEQMPFGGEIY